MNEEYADIIKELEAVHAKYRNHLLAGEELLRIGNLCDAAADLIKVLVPKGEMSTTFTAEQLDSLNKAGA